MGKEMETAHKGLEFKKDGNAWITLRSLYMISHAIYAMTEFRYYCCSHSNCPIISIASHADERPNTWQGSMISCRPMQL